MPVERQRGGHVDAVVGKEAVGFVGHEIDDAADALRGFFQHGGEAHDVFFGVDSSGGVVGGVDDERAGAGRDGGGKGLHVGTEVFGPAGNRMQRAAVIAHVEAVFAEEGSHGEHFVAGFEHGVEKGVHHACRRSRA